VAKASSNFVRNNNLSLQTRALRKIFQVLFTNVIRKKGPAVSIMGKNYYMRQNKNYDARQEKLQNFVVKYTLLNGVMVPVFTIWFGKMFPFKI
jgi:hypothetical protein